VSVSLLPKRQGFPVTGTFLAHADNLDAPDLTGVHLHQSPMLIDVGLIGHDLSSDCDDPWHETHHFLTIRRE
jgi:hypothetical protein